MIKELQIDGDFEVLTLQDVFEYSWAFSWLKDQAEERGLPSGIINFLSDFSRAFSSEAARCSGFAY